MKKKGNMPWLFWLELIDLLFIPFVIWWGNTPTNVLNASAGGQLLEAVGILGGEILFFSALPLGILGLVFLKKQSKLRLATKIMSIVLLSVGSLMLLGFLVILYCVVFLGYSV